MIAPSRAHAVALACVAAAIAAFALGLHVLSGDVALSRVPAVSADFGRLRDIVDPVKREDLVRHLAGARATVAPGCFLRGRTSADERLATRRARTRRHSPPRPRWRPDPAIWCEYADALGMTQGGRLEGRPRELVMKRSR
jgi:hypothetical protein